MGDLCVKNQFVILFIMEDRDGRDLLFIRLGMDWTEMRKKFWDQETQGSGSLENFLVLSDMKKFPGLAILIVHSLLGSAYVCGTACIVRKWASYTVENFDELYDNAEQARGTASAHIVSECFSLIVFLRLSHAARVLEHPSGLYSNTGLLYIYNVAQKILADLWISSSYSSFDCKNSVVGMGSLIIRDILY